MDFVAIDFETANSSRSSACAVGIVEVTNGKIIFEQSWLIDPRQHFDGMNISIHGITPSMVADQPTFMELWPTIHPLLKGKNVVAHNASFDMSVLRYCLDEAAINYPIFQYFCTYLISKKLLQNLPSHKLNVIAEHYGIPLKHHDALDDSRAAALLLLKILEQEQCESLLQLSETCGFKIGEMHVSGYKPFSAAKGRTNKKLPLPATTETKTLPVSKGKQTYEQRLQLIRGQKKDITVTF